MSHRFTPEEKEVFDLWLTSLPGPVTDEGTCYVMHLVVPGGPPLSISINKAEVHLGVQNYVRERKAP